MFRILAREYKYTVAEIKELTFFQANELFKMCKYDEDEIEYETEISEADETKKMEEIINAYRSRGLTPPNFI